MIKGAATYRRTINMESAVGTIQTLESAPKSIQGMLDNAEMKIDEIKKAIPQLEKTVAKPFEHTDKLQGYITRENEIKAILLESDEKAANIDTRKEQYEKLQSNGWVRSGKNSYGGQTELCELIVGRNGTVGAENGVNTRSSSKVSLEDSRGNQISKGVAKQLEGTFISKTESR